MSCLRKRSFQCIDVEQEWERGCGRGWRRETDQDDPGYGWEICEWEMNTIQNPFGNQSVNRLGRSWCFYNFYNDSDVLVRLGVDTLTTLLVILSHDPTQRQHRNDLPKSVQAQMSSVLFIFIFSILFIFIYHCYLQHQQQEPWREKKNPKPLLFIMNR